MKLGYNLNLEQQQKLIMTPELRQAIELLQLNTVELGEYITKELEENPMLEPEDDRKKEEESLDDKALEEVDWEEYFDNASSYEYRTESDKNQEQVNFESFIRQKPNMHEDLISQLNICQSSEEDCNIGRILIQSLDKDGYLTIDIETLANDLQVPVNRIEKILKIIQKLEPIGLGARSLEECLLIQVEEDTKAAEYIKDIIRLHLKDIAYNRIDKISKNLGITKKEVLEAIEYIRKLEPKPGRQLDQQETVKYITADAEIKLVDGEFKVILNEDSGPRLNINNYYKSMMKTNKDDGTKNYLYNRFNRAMWVIQSIEQRKNTIKKVLESIVKFQKDFLLEGEKYLKPLTMKEVAEDIDMHESTVSRVTTGKYVQTPQGLFEFKYFFTTGLLGIDGDVSSTSIKSSIKDIIDNEDSKKPFSDQKISDILKEKGVKVSRRTVAKYRNELGILSSSMRRGL